METLVGRIARILPLSQRLAEERYARVLLDEMKDRIFGRGEATQGTMGGYRSESHKKRRRANNPPRQVGYKDLVLTGRLIRFLQVRNNEIVWQSREAAQIAEYQETSPNQVNKPIFTARREELDAAAEAYAKLLTEDVLRRAGGRP